MSGHRKKTSMNGSVKEKFENVKEWIIEHTKIVMPVVLLLCVAVTVIVAVNSNKKAAKEEAQVAGAAETMNAIEPIPEIEEVQLELNAYPAVNELVNSYYAAILARDTQKVTAFNPYLNDKDKIYTLELSKYVESYPTLDVYTKPGPIEGSYMVYIYSQTKFLEHDKLLPGMQVFYVCPDEEGNLFINYKANYGEESETVMNFISQVSDSEDVNELRNKVDAEYSELVDGDQELQAFIEDLGVRIDASTGEVLAQAQAPVATGEEPEAAAASETEESVPTEETNVVKTVKAKEVVNIRSSDSETADKVGKALSGDEFTLLEEKENGWSKISFEGKDAYIKSDFLEEVSVEMAADTTQEDEAPAPAEEPEPAAKPQESTASTGDGKTVTVKESVNIRKSASEDGEKLALVYAGEKLEVVMKQADGWTKVKYKGETAYVKSDYVE